MYIEVCEQILRRTVLSFYERNQLSKIKEDLGGGEQVKRLEMNPCKLSCTKKASNTQK